MATNPPTGTHQAIRADRSEKAPGDICDTNLVLLRGAGYFESALQHCAVGPVSGDRTSDHGTQAVELGQLGWAETGFQLELHDAACCGF